MKQKLNYEMELAGKIALVTGGIKGAGKAIADRLLQAGATVLISARNRQDDIDPDIHFIGADLSTSEGTEAVIREVSKFGIPDILVNNLGSSETMGGGYSVQSM